MVSTQFAPQGVTFVRDSTYSNPILQAATGQARSPIRVLNISQGDAEFAVPRVEGSFAELRTRVSVWVRNVTGGAFTSHLTLRLRDPNGAVIASSNGGAATDVPSGGGYVLLSASSASTTPQVASFTLDGNALDQGQSVLIDDLEFDDPPAAAEQPAIAVRDGGFGPLSVVQGGTTSRRLIVDRLNHSSGDVALSTGALPPGVTATFSPQVLTGTDTSTVVTLSAGHSATPTAVAGAVTVVATPTASTAGTAVGTLSLPLAVNAVADVRVLGMEVTQAVQNTQLPMPDPAHPDRPVSYSGVKLVSGRETIVRVFANVSALRVGTSIPSPPGLLRGGRQSGANGQAVPFPESPLMPLAVPSSLRVGAANRIPFTDRIDPNAVYSYVLPAAWTAQPGTLVLTAEVNPSELSGSFPECGACQSNNQMTLTDVHFEHHDAVRIAPIRIVGTDSHNHNADVSAPACSSCQFDTTRVLVPLAPEDLIVAPYDGRQVDISDVLGRFGNDRRDDRRGAIFDRVADFNTGHAVVGSLAQGIYGGPNDLGGLEAPVYYFPAAITPVALTYAGRPVGSVTHEFMHSRGYFHAAHCGNDFPAVDWPDATGGILGVGIDPRGTPGSPGVFPTFSPEVFKDVMSYCGDDTTRWISTKHWNSWGDFLPSGVPTIEVTPGTARDKTAGPFLRVVSMVDGAGATILRVQSGHGTVGIDQSSPYHYIVRNAAGQVVSDTPMGATGVHSDPDRTHAILLSGEVPAAGAASVSVTAAGVTLATRTRSPHAPRVSVISPRAGARLRPGAAVSVRWHASDADGDALQVTVEYSANGGRTYTMLTDGVHGSSVRLPAAGFSRSRHARVRVTVSDGFNETVVQSGVFVAPGSPPSVRIIEPRGRVRTVQAAPLYLAGDAFADDATQLLGRHLTWYDGRRIIGRGPTVSITGLKPGAHKLRLVATDAYGRRGSAAIVVGVRASVPELLGLSLPSRISAHARRLRFATAATVACTLTVSGRTFHVDRHRRRFSVTVRPGKSRLLLRFRLRNADRTVVLRHQILRG